MFVKCNNTTTPMIPHCLTTSSNYVSFFIVLKEKPKAVETTRGAFRLILPKLTLLFPKNPVEILGLNKLFSPLASVPDVVLLKMMKMMPSSYLSSSLCLSDTGRFSHIGSFEVDLFLCCCSYWDRMCKLAFC